ncbi:MAG: murein biosynthesis integral membrane protein MurJ [Acidobacteriota bacterium]
MTEPPERLAPAEKPPGPARTGGPAVLVFIGILCSRVTGLVRQRVFAHYFGLGPEADAFLAAFKIPNFLQNLFGEGVLSGSLIPVYASLVARGDRRHADRVAGAVGSLLGLVVSVVVLVGVVATPLLIGLIAPGFTGPTRELTIQVVRILFPGAGLLVLSAWCLGVLNSHHRFLISYTAPVVWNAAMIATLVMFGAQTPLPRLAGILAWGSVIGSGLQLAVQVPMVWRVAPDLRFALDATSAEVRTVVRNFIPVFISRGVAQFSAYVDLLLASLLPTGAVAGLTNAQTLYLLPVSLFGMSVSAAELPAMSGVATVDAAGFAALRRRLDAGLRQIAFFVVPSAMAFLALGDVLAAALLQTGRFGPDEAVYVWGILAGSAVGLLASTLARLYSSSYYALRDTRTPLRFAIVRLVLTTSLGYLCAIPLPRWLGISERWGVAGLTVSAGVAGWIEMLLLRRALNARIGPTGLPASYVTMLWLAAGAGAATAWAIKLTVPIANPVLAAVAILGPYGLVFLAIALALRIPEAATLVSRLTARRRVKAG